MPITERIEAVLQDSKRIYAKEWADLDNRPHLYTVFVKHADGIQLIRHAYIRTMENGEYLVVFSEHFEPYVYVTDDLEFWVQINPATGAFAGEYNTEYYPNTSILEKELFTQLGKGD
jgi:hypothetical protein